MFERLIAIQPIEKTLLHDPFKREHWEVYADWLQVQEDPRGNLLNMMLHDLKPYNIDLFQNNEKVQAVWQQWIAIDRNIPQTAVLLLDSITAELLKTSIANRWADLLIQKLSVDKFPEWLIDLSLTERKPEIISILHSITFGYSRNKDYFHSLAGLLKIQWENKTIDTEDAYNIISQIIDDFDIEIENGILNNFYDFEWTFISDEEKISSIEFFLNTYEEDAQTIKDHYGWILL